MAMTGGTSYLLKSEVTNYGNGNDTTSLYLYVKQSQTATTNQSKVYLGLYVTSKYNIGQWDDWDKASYVGLATSGSDCHKFDGTLPKGSGTRWLVENVAYTVSHNSDGTKSLPIYWKWNVNSPWGQFVNPSGSKTVALSNIDRTAPTVSCSVSSITTNSFSISATSNVQCDVWQYSLDNGSTWKQFSTPNGTSASVTVSSLTPNTSYSVKVKARKTSNYVYGTSSANTAKTLGQAKLNSCASFYVDADTVNFYPNVTVYEASFTEYVVFKDGSTEIARSAGYKWSAGTANRTITMAQSKKDLILKAMTTVKSKNFTLVVETYNGSTLVGTSSCTVTVNTSNENSCPSWVSPYISWADTSDLVSLTGNDQLLIQGHSTLVVNAVGVSARNFASIKSYSVTIGEKTVTSSTAQVNVGTVDTGGDLTMKLTVTDSRGHSAYVTRTVKVLKYESPKITKCTVRRANGIDTTIQLSFSGTMSVIKPDGSTDVNSFVNVSYRYKETSKPGNFNDDGTGWSESITIHNDVVRSSSGTSFSFETNELLNLDVNNSFDLRIVVKDQVASFVKNYVIPQGIPLVAFRKNKLGVNKPTPNRTMDVGGDIGFEGGIYNENGRNVVGDTGWIDLGLSDSVTANTSTGGHYNGCAYRVVGGNHVYVAFNCRAEFSGATVIVSGTPIPTEHKPKMQPYAIVTLNGSRVARILVSRSTGHVAIDWIRNVADDVEPETHTATWIDGYMDYWLD